MIFPMLRLVTNAIAFGGLAAGLWALAYVDDPAARFIMYYTTLCAFLAPLLFVDRIFFSPPDFSSFADDRFHTDDRGNEKKR
jgi:uncharacterized membrane protein YozB (DUF420 family)